MEVNLLLQQAIVVHHMIQVVCPAVVIIICVATSPFFPWISLVLLSAIIPTLLFITIWIASKCNYLDLTRILVHFNTILSTLWFLVFFPFCIVSPILMDGILPIFLAIITGLLSLSSAIFAVYGIWKSARNVVLSARSARCEHYDVLDRFSSPYETPVTFTDLNSMRLPQATGGQPVSTP